MGTYRSQFSRLQLWQGAILGTIAHAIWVAHHPDLAYEQSWEGPNYIVQNSMGAYGTVTFAENSVVGVFFDSHSSRSPYRSEGSYDLRSFLSGIPENLLVLANQEALQYVLQEYKGITMPIITAAFWSEDDYLTAAKPWQEVFANGAHLVRIQLLDTEKAIAEWQTNYELKSSQVELTRSLFYRKVTRPQTQIVLDDQERSVLASDGTEGIEVSRELLAGIGIILP